MSVQDIEAAVSSLAPNELRVFRDWFEDFLDEAWDRQIEKDVANGKLDQLIAQADKAFEEGRCKPL